MNAIIVMSRAPIPNETKTRLMPDLTGEQCAELHKSFLKDIFRLLVSMKKGSEIGRRRNKEKDPGNDALGNGDNNTEKSKIQEIAIENMDIVLSYTPGNSLNEFEEVLAEYSEEIEALQQVEGDIGVRMSSAMENLFNSGYSKVVLIGSDIPSIKKEDIKIAFDKLEDNDVVFGKTDDGGYYLVGMSSYTPETFNIDKKLWGGEDVFENTVNHLKKKNKKVNFTNTRYDIDYIEDIFRYKDEENRETETLKYIKKLERENCLKIDC